VRLGARHRDVRESQLVVGLLLLVRPHVRDPVRTALATDVAHPVLVLVVEDRGGRLTTGPLVPREGHHHDRELQALAGVHRDDLHRGGVGLQLATALLSTFAGSFLATASQPDEQRRETELSLQRRLVQHLRDVPQVREQPFAADLAEDAALHLL
jgi:hypothetical protein